MKHSLIHHLIAITILLLLSVVQLSSWSDSHLEEHLAIYCIFAILSVVIGYARPIFPIGFRWLALIGIFFTVCIVSDGNDWGIMWLAMLQCLFVIAIVLRRIVMETTENPLTTSRSAFRALYDLMDDKYNSIAKLIDKTLGRDNPVSMLPVAHSTAILSLSFIFLCISIEGGEFHFEEYGYSVIPGLTVAIILFYVMKASIKGNDFFKNLLSALAMFVMGFVAMVICSLMAIMAIISITTLFNAISNLIKKLFG